MLLLNNFHQCQRGARYCLLAHSIKNKMKSTNPISVCTNGNNGRLGRFCLWKIFSYFRDYFQRDVAGREIKKHSVSDRTNIFWQKLLNRKKSIRANNGDTSRKSNFHRQFVSLMERWIFRVGHFSFYTFIQCFQAVFDQFWIYFVKQKPISIWNILLGHILGRKCLEWVWFH